MYEPAVLTVYEPVVYTPPPPPPPAKPNPTVSVNRCRLCLSLVEHGREPGHRDWHLANGLHGAGCALIASMTAQRGANALLALDACSCGLEDDDKKEK
jgi:hypothetical protein